MQLPRAGRLARLLIPTVFAALVAPGVAQAHHTAVPIVALDYANRILPGAAGPDGVHATLEDAGRKLRLTVAPGRQAQTPTRRRRRACGSSRRGPLAA